jgi:DNA-binding SARP family transcriptional activator
VSTGHRYGSATVTDVLDLSLFGAPRVCRDGRNLRFDTRKAIALLAALAVTARPHSRDAVCELLWPDLDRGRARAALRRTLSVAAAQLPELVTDGTAVWLDLTAVRCDVTEFRRLVQSDEPSDWATAAALAAEEFLDGFALRDSAAFDEWQNATAAELRDDLSFVLGLLATQATRDGDAGTALEHARRRVAVDPLSEPARVELIRATAHTGDRIGAIEAYRALVRILDRELGVAPLPQTTALYEAIRAGRSIEPAGRAARTGSASIDVVSRADAEQDHDADEARAVAALSRQVAARLAAVSEVTRQSVEAVAALGGSPDLDLIRAVTGRGEPETREGLAEAARSGLLVQRGGGYTVAHILVTDEALREQSLVRRRLLHGRAADALARRRAVDLVTSPARAIAAHLVEAGRETEAGEWFRTAAVEASARSAHALAVEQLRAAVVLGRDSVAVEQDLAAALVRLGRYDEALNAYEQAAALAADGPALAAIDHAIARVHDRLGEWVLAQARLEHAASLADGPLQARILADLALMLHRRGLDGEASTMARRAEVRASGDDAALAQAGNVLGVIALARGAVGEARAVLESAVALARNSDDDLLIAALNNRSRAEAESGDLSAALDSAQAALALAQPQADLHRLAALHSHLADLLHAAGQEDEALEQLKQSAAAFAGVVGAGERPQVWTLTEW